MKQNKKGVYRFIKADRARDYLAYKGSLLLRNTELEEELKKENTVNEVLEKDFNLEEFISDIKLVIEKRIRELVKIK